jgi:tRNA dimethylallyltransferase
MYAAIDARFDDMMSAGAMAEAEAFKELGLAGDLPASRAVGVAELVRVINGELDLDLAVEKAKTASRQLAKRQITWFKRQIHTDLLISEKYSERNDEKIFSFIREFLLTRPD